MTREHAAESRRRNGVEFDVLSDPGNAVAALFGLAFELPPDLKEIYGKFGIDLARYDGDDSWTLPMPARFVIDRDGRIRAADVDPDYTRRPEPEKTLADLAKLTT